MPSFRPPQCTESPKNIKSQPRSISSCPRRKCTESPKNIKSQHRWSKATLVGSVLNLQRTSNHNKPSQLLCCFVSVLNLQRTSNHNCSGCATIQGLSVLNLQRTSNHNCSVNGHNHAPSVLNLQRTSNHNNEPYAGRRVFSVLNLQRTSNHNYAEVKELNRSVYWISKEHQITTRFQLRQSRWQCTESPKNIKSQLEDYLFGPRWSVLNLQRTSNHNFA